MNTEKAIELLERNKAGLCHDCMHPQKVGWCENHCGLPEAFDMAIEALKAQSDGDTISRKAAIDAISCNIIVTGKQNAELVAATIGTFVDRIKALPPVQPEVLACGEGELIAQPETKRCDNCRHEKSQWFNRCADCFDYELWEGKEE